jgi:hypothetical protein
MLTQTLRTAKELGMNRLHVDSEELLNRFADRKSKRASAA